MKIAVISDIHDNIWSLAEVLEDARAEGAEALVVCGDLCAPFSLQAIADGFGGPIHVVFGNNDGDQFLLERVAAGCDHVNLHGLYAELDFDGHRVAVVHYEEIGRRLAASGFFQAVFYGHSHEPRVQRVNGCLTVNPGEVMGRLGTVTYAVYDTEDQRATVKTVPAS